MPERFIRVVPENYRMIHMGKARFACGIWTQGRKQLL
jgi:hypothetical protein